MGAVGGTGGEGKAVPYFMVRIRVPNGFATAEQLRTIADLAEAYGRGIADITVRQNFQLHWVTIEALPDIVRRLAAVGISTLGTCGDVTRNITGCPVAGIDADEIADASDLVVEPHRSPERQSRLLQPAAQVQGLDQRVPRVVHLSRDQRRRA